MKKAKWLTFVLALTLAASLCLVACGDKGDGGNGENAQNMVSEQVSAEQWANAFKAENFEKGKLVMEMTRTSKYEIEDDVFVDAVDITKMTTEYDGDKQHAVAEYSYGGDPAYVEENKEDAGTMEAYAWKVDDGIYILYEREGADKDWFFEVDDEGVMGDTFEGLSLYAEAYEGFEYNADKKGYVPKPVAGAPSMFNGMVIKFKGGKVSAVLQEMEYGKDEDAVKIVTSIAISYGAQTITLPTMPAHKMAGTWKLDTLELRSSPQPGEGSLGDYDVNDDENGGNILEIGDGDEITLTPDHVQIVVNSNGTASFVFMKGTIMESEGNGAWEWWGNSGSFYANGLPKDANNEYYTDRIEIVYDETAETLSFAIKLTMDDGEGGDFAVYATVHLKKAA